MKPKILVVFRHPEARAMVTGALRDDYDVTTVHSGRSAIEAVRNTEFALVVSNDMLTDMTGEVLTSRVRTLSPATHVVITATRQNAELAMDLLGTDEFASYVEKPLSDVRIRHAVASALERARLRRENAALRGHNTPEAEGESSVRDWPKIHRVFRFGSIRDMEKLMILNRLEENAQNRTRSAESLEISVRTLRNKLHEYNVPPRSQSRREQPEDAVLV